MTNLKLFAAAIAAAVSLNSCFLDDDDFLSCERGQGPTVTRTLELPSFSGIDLKISGNVVIKQGPEQFVEVEGQENIIELLKLNVNNDTWDIRFEDCVRNHEDLTIYITLPEIGYLSISGSGRIEGDELLAGNDLNLRISGSGDMDLQLDYDKVDATISGSGDIKLEGDCQDFDLDITGSGDYHAFDLETQTGDINITGSGNAEVFVHDNLDVRITGSGNVYYIGNPFLDIQITGSGKVKDAN